MAEATMKAVRDYFNEDSVRPMSVKEFADNWKLLTEQDKTDLKQGIGDGTLTY